MTRSAPHSLLAAILYLGLAVFANPAAAEPDIAALEALRAGDMKKLVLSMPAEPLEGTVTRPDGSAVALAEYRGKVVLVNFWATWCAPCRKEMPSLNALDAALGGADFDVIAIASGRNALPAIEAFYAEEGIDRLEILLDPRSDLTRGAGVFGLPTTLILDPDGREIGRLQGDADWAHADAQAILKAIVAATN